MNLSETALCISAHAHRPLLAAGLLSGGVELGNTSGLTQVSLPGSTRSLAFPSSASSTSLFCASDLGHLSLVDSGTASVISLASPASPSRSPPPSSSATGASSASAPTSPSSSPRPALSALTVLSGSDSVVAAGDDEGGVHLFDARAGESAGGCTPVASAFEQGDYVAALVQCPGAVNLAVASGDGTLCVYDFRMPPRPRVRLVAETPSFEDDLLSLALVADGSRAVAGTLSGAVNVYNMKLAEVQDDEDMDKGKFVERFYGHPESVSAIVPYKTDGIVLTGSSDGIVRVVEPVQRVFGGVLPYMKGSAKGGGDAKDKKGEDGERDGATLGSNVGGKERSGSDSEGLSAGEGSDTNERKSGGERRSRKKDMLWPIEGMAVLNEEDNPLLAVIGHSSRIRFCELSILDDSDESEAEGDEGREDAEVRDKYEAEGSADDVDGKTAGCKGDSEKESRPSKRLKSIATSDKRGRAAPDDEASFFDGL